MWRWSHLLVGKIVVVYVRFLVALKICRVHFAHTCLRVHIHLYRKKKHFWLLGTARRSQLLMLFYVDGLSSFIVVDCRLSNGQLSIVGHCWLGGLCVGCRCQLLICRSPLTFDICWLLKIVQRLSVYRLLSVGVGVGCRWKFVLWVLSSVYCSRYHMFSLFMYPYKCEPTVPL